MLSRQAWVSNYSLEVRISHDFFESCECIPRCLQRDKRALKLIMMDRRFLTACCEELQLITHTSIE